MTEPTPKPTDAHRVEDSHAALKADIEDARRELRAFLAELCEEQPPDTRAIEWIDEIVCNLDVAARVEQLGRWAQAEKERVASNMQEVAEQEMERRGRVEDKKAAFLEAARAAEGDEDAWASLRYKFRALGLVVESASKKEDA